MKRYLQTFLSIGFCLLFSNSFSQQNADTAKNNKEALAALNGYIDAIKEHDISKALSYYANSKDFLVFADGKALNYEEFTAALRTSFSQFRQMLVRYDSVYVRSISENAVLITGRFHETVTDIDGRQFDLDVTISAVFVKTNGQWKVAYVTQVDQFPSN